MALDPYQPHRRVLLGVSEVRELNTLKPWIPIRDTFVCWLLIVAAWASVALVRDWWVLLIAIPLIGNRFYALFVIGHDGMHRRASNLIFGPRFLPLQRMVSGCAIGSVRANVVPCPGVLW